MFWRKNENSKQSKLDVAHLILDTSGLSVECRPEQAQRRSGIRAVPAIHWRNGAAPVPAYKKSQPRSVMATIYQPTGS